MLQGYTHSYYLSVKGTYYLISYFRLHLQCDQIQTLLVTLPIGLFMSTKSLGDDVISPAFLLFQAIQSKLDLLPILVLLMDLYTQELVFRGILAGMHLTAHSTGALQLVCQCLGMASKLMYNPISDYIIIPKGCLNPVNIATSGLGCAPSLRHPWAYIHGTLIALCNSVQRRSGLTLLNMFQLAQLQLLSIIRIQLAGHNINDYKGGPKIALFIKSLYKLGKLTKLNNDQSSGDEKKPIANSFVRGLCAAFLRQIQSGGTIYQCLYDTLGLDVFLCLVPGGTGLYMYITPTYLYRYLKDKNVELTASDIVSIDPNIIASLFIKTPGTVYANFTATSEYGKPNPLKTITNYGVYKFIDNASSFKMLAGPSWCLDMVQARRRLPNTVYDGKLDMNLVAKLMFFLRYGRGSTCVLLLAPTNNAYKLRSQLGKAVCIKPEGIKVNKIILKGMKLLGSLYGQLRLFSITYAAALTSRSQGGSSLRILAVLDRFWSSQSKFSLLFTAKATGRQLYTKV